MRKHTKILARTVVLVVAGWFAGCNGTIDDGAPTSSLKSRP